MTPKELQSLLTLQHLNRDYITNRDGKVVRIKSPFAVFKVLSQRNYGEYVTRKEVISGFEWGAGLYTMSYAYSTYTGEWIGQPRQAYVLAKKFGLSQIQTAHKTDCVCSLGFNEKEQKWYGWSHRAIFGFGIGNKLFEEDFGDDTTLFSQHGRKTIKTLEQAKEAAIRFAESVS